MRVEGRDLSRDLDLKRQSEEYFREGKSLIIIAQSGLPWILLRQRFWRRVARLQTKEAADR